MNKTVLKLLAQCCDSLVYVDCGARGEKINPLVDLLLPQALYIGFEPDQAACTELHRQAKRGYIYFPVAVGQSSETRTLYLTHNPACSSLLLPNDAFFGQFLDCASQVEVKDTRPVQTVALDSFLPTEGINQLDFLELDTQGTELEILCGAEEFLSSCTLGLRVEVEFSAMYRNQFLFSDVDSYVRQFGFMLFDLTRHRYRRQNCPLDLPARGQLLYGHAFYLKDYRQFPKEISPQIGIKLALIATFYGFHDYAFEIIDSLIQNKAGQLKEGQLSMLTSIHSEYVSWLGKSSQWIKLLFWLENSPFKRLFRKVAIICERATYAYSLVTVKRNSSWSD